MELLLRRCHSRVDRKDGLGRAGKDPGIHRLALGPSWREFGFVGRRGPHDDRTRRAQRSRASFGRSSGVLDPTHGTEPERLVVALRDSGALAEEEKDAESSMPSPPSEFPRRPLLGSS
jgi:hypothetical protein